MRPFPVTFIWLQILMAESLLHFSKIGAGLSGQHQPVLF